MYITSPLTEQGDCMSVPINQRVSNIRSILNPAIVLAAMVSLMLLAVEAIQTSRLSSTQEEMFPLPATQSLEGGGSIVYGEPTAIP